MGRKKGSDPATDDYLEMNIGMSTIYGVLLAYGCSILGLWRHFYSSTRSGTNQDIFQTAFNSLYIFFYVCALIFLLLGIWGFMHRPRKI